MRYENDSMQFSPTESIPLNQPWFENCHELLHLHPMHRTPLFAIKIKAQKIDKSRSLAAAAAFSIHSADPSIACLLLKSNASKKKKNAKEVAGECVANSNAPWPFHFPKMACNDSKQALLLVACSHHHVHFTSWGCHWHHFFFAAAILFNRSEKKKQRTNKLRDRKSSTCDGRPPI